MARYFHLQPFRRKIRALLNVRIFSAKELIFKSRTLIVCWTLVAAGLDILSFQNNDLSDSEENVSSENVC